MNPSDRKTLLEAAKVIDEEASLIFESHTTAKRQWTSEEASAKAEYDRLRLLADRVRDVVRRAR